MTSGIDLVGVVTAYHERTKHRLDRYATGPEALDWSAQPNPFREFAGAPRILLPLGADKLAVPFNALHGAVAVEPKALDVTSLGLLFELSFALSAWKEYGPDRWALRCNPSSGNLHPTEAYAICRGITGIEDGLYHYVSRDHALELRCRYAAHASAPSLHIGLGSVAWREAWKYGERAFRYCQHDTGHAIGALRYAAATLGWQMCIDETLAHDRIAHLLGLDRDGDFAGAEREEPELLAQLGPVNSGQFDYCDDEPHWIGKANLLDPHPMYHWPVIDEASVATRKPQTAATVPVMHAPIEFPAATCAIPAATIIRQRRSAQHFDPHKELALQDFYRLLRALLPSQAAPWDVWPHLARVHPVIFVHRVVGLPPGLYALPRRAGIHATLRTALQEDFIWERPDTCPDDLPLYRLLGGDARKAMRTISCHQAIAADAAFAVAMLAEFEQTLSEAPWRYRQLHWEAGLVGQVLYLEAEAAGVRATGIGCYFDDVCHELLGLRDRQFQSVYHFTVGTPHVDDRILSLPPYTAVRIHSEPA